MEKIQITLETVEPVILTTQGSSLILTESRDVFSGSVLRGIFAARYMTVNGLTDKAHEDAGFRQAFFGPLRFVDATLSQNGCTGPFVYRCR